MRVFPPDDRREQHRSAGDLGDRVVAPAQVPDVGGQRHGRGQDRSDDRAVRVDEGRGGSHRSPDVGPQQGWTRRQIKEGTARADGLTPTERRDLLASSISQLNGRAVNVRSAGFDIAPGQRGGTAAAALGASLTDVRCRTFDPLYCRSFHASHRRSHWKRVTDLSGWDGENNDVFRSAAGGVGLSVHRHRGVRSPARQARGVRR